MKTENESKGRLVLGLPLSSELLRLIAMGATALFSFIGLERALLPFPLVAIGATILGGLPVYKEMIHSLWHKRVTIEVSMTIAVIASLIVAEFTAAVIIAFFAVFTEYIEEYAVDRARDTVSRLEGSTPKVALVRRGGTELEVSPEDLKLGDLVVVRQGDRIPVDGIVANGNALVNQSMITGEAISSEKSPGDRVYAGSVNESGLLEIRTEKIGTDTVFGKIIQLVDEAEQRRAPVQKISDRLATWLVEFAIGFAVLTFLITRSPISSISVIVVAGSCGVAAGTPLAIVAILGKAAKKGVIVKGGIYIEELTRVDTVIVDKTGTLTLGVPEVVRVESLDGHDEKESLAIAAAAERHSNHPIANAITRQAKLLEVDPLVHSAFTAFPGKGVISEHDGQRILVGSPALLLENGISVPPRILETARSSPATTVLVAHDNRLCASIQVSDKVRAESKRAVEDLRKLGIRTIMMTGDNEAASKAVAGMVGMDEVYSQLLPQDKVRKIEDLVGKGRHVVMVGDGINDAPALARANVGIGMGAGTDVAIEEADVVLMTNDLEKIANLIRMSRGGYRAIMENFYGTIGVDSIGVALAFMGLLNPLLAATIHTVSELVFIANSARLMR